MPPSKQPRLLPIDDAEIKMETWIPWAIARIRLDLDHMATMFNTLTVEQMAEVDAEPENEADERGF